MKKKIDSTLFDLCIGIILYGIVFQLVLLVFSEKTAFLGTYLKYADEFAHSHMPGSVSDGGGMVCKRLCAVLHVAATGETYDGSFVRGGLQENIRKGFLRKLLRNNSCVSYITAYYYRLRLEIRLLIFRTMRGDHGFCVE